MKYYTASVFLAIALCLHSCHVPQDPENSWQEAMQTGLLVGMVSHPPFTILKEGKYAGREVAMMNEFADRHQLTIKWVQGSESELIDKIKAYQLHLMIGGFDKKTVWANEVGMTQPYDDEHVWLVARGENELVEQVERYFIKNKKSL